MTIHNYIYNSSKYFIICLIVLFGLNTNAQSEFFHEIEIGTQVLEKESFNIDVTASWKHLYDEVGWRRWGVNTKVTKKTNNWSLNGGLAIYFTFHKEIDNFLEVRPYIGIGLKTRISDKLDFKQRIRTEWRNFIYSGDSDNENYLRPRYKIGLDYLLSENEETHEGWKLVTDFEWYFNKDTASGERFAQSREFGFKIIRELKNKHEIGLGYKYEKLTKLFHNHEENGNIIVLEYRF